VDVVVPEVAFPMVRIYWNLILNFQGKQMIKAILTPNLTKEQTESLEYAIRTLNEVRTGDDFEAVCWDAARQLAVNFEMTNEHP
jgi:hypothetical protein